MSARERPDPEELLAQAGWLRRLARGLVQDANAADDLVQDTWVAALENGPRESHALGPWLARVARNLAHRRVRAEAHRKQREERGARPEGVVEVSERVALQRELLELVLALDEPYRSTLLERYFEERSPSEIARQSEISVRTVKTRLARGLALLRERLDRRHADDRGAFVLALAGFARERVPTSALIGGLLVNSKLAVACAVVLAAALGIYWRHAEKPALETAALPSGTTPPSLEASGAAQVESASLAARTTTAPPVASSVAVPDDDSGVLRGIIVDSRHVPISGARIEVLRAPGLHDVASPPFDEAREHVASLTSDAQGRFRHEVVPGLSFDLEIRARGFASLSNPGHFAGDELEIVLGAPATLSGQVKHRNSGQPCAGALVRCGAMGSEFSGPIQSDSHTDELGRFELRDLPAGAISLDIIPVDAEAMYAIPLLILSGNVVSREFLAEDGTDVDGLVVDDATGEPVAGATIDPLFAGLGSSTTSGLDGRFHLRAVGDGSTPAHARFHVRAESYATERVFKPLPFEGSMHVEVRLHSGATARGSLVDSEGRPVAGASVRAVGRGVGYESNATRSDAHGRFELRGLRRDMQYLLRIDADGAAMRALAFPGPPIRDACVDFGEIGLSTPALLRGRLVDRDGRGIEGYYVCLNTDRVDSGPFPSEQGAPSQDLKHQVRTDSRGRFALGNLRGGSYWIWAGRKGCARTVEQEIQVEAGAVSGELVLTLDLGASISGVLLGPDERPVPKAVLNFYAPGDDLNRVAYLLTAADGKFQMEGLAVGEYTIVADPSSLYHQDDPWPPNRWEHVASGTRDARLELLAADPIEGTVVLADGSRATPCVVWGARAGSAMNGWPEFQAFTDGEGRFRLLVPQHVRVDLSALHNDGKVETGMDHAEATNISAGTKDLELKFVQGH